MKTRPVTLKKAIMTQRIEQTLIVGPKLLEGVSLGNSISKKQEIQQGEAVATTNSSIRKGFEHDKPFSFSALANHEASWTTSTFCASKSLVSYVAKSGRWIKRSELVGVDSATSDLDRPTGVGAYAEMIWHWSTVEFHEVPTVDAGRPKLT